MICLFFKQDKLDHFDTLQDESEEEAGPVLSPDTIGNSSAYQLSSSSFTHAGKEPLPALVSLIAGLIGGAAGPGALLAVVPAGYYSTWQESCAYILVFAFSSTLLMGLVALGYGELTFRFAKDSELLVKRLYLFSSSMSIAVGIAWIALTLCGILGTDHRQIFRDLSLNIFFCNDLLGS